MAGKTDVLEADFLKWLTGQSTTILGGSPNTPWVGLFTTIPTDSAAGTEVSGGAYGRINSTGKWPAITVGSVSNNVAVSYSIATADWGTLTAFGIFTASTGGTLLYYGNLVDGSSNPITKFVGNGDTFAFQIGQITVTED